MARRSRGEETRERALDAALRTYARVVESGADKELTFSVHAIAAESGVSLGSLYHHFGSMDGLAAAVYARCMGELLDAVVSALQGARSPRRGTHAIVRAYLAFAARRPIAARFIHASAYASFLPAQAELIRYTKAPRLAVVRAFYLDHMRARRVVQLPEQLLEMLIIGPVAEVTRRWLAGAPDVNLDEAARLLPERVWRSIRP
jgi:AcrR family transcriptional regulator